MAKFLLENSGERIILSSTTYLSILIFQGWMTLVKRYKDHLVQRNGIAHYWWWVVILHFHVLIWLLRTEIWKGFRWGLPFQRYGWSWCRSAWRRKNTFYNFGCRCRAKECCPNLGFYLEVCYGRPIYQSFGHSKGQSRHSGAQDYMYSWLFGERF